MVLMDRSSSYHQYETILGTRIDTYWNSLQTANDLWVGLVAREGLQEATILAVFPEDRPWKKYWITVADNENEIKIEPSNYEGDSHYFLEDEDGRRWVYWEVLNPEPGYVYQLRWSW